MPGWLVMMPSTPAAISQAICSGSSMVHTYTRICEPELWLNAFRCATLKFTSLWSPIHLFVDKIGWPILAQQPHTWDSFAKTEKDVLCLSADNFKLSYFAALHDVAFEIASYSETCPINGAIGTVSTTTWTAYSQRPRFVSSLCNAWPTAET